MRKNHVKRLCGASPSERPASGASIVIIGMGNEFQGDDGIGPFVVRELRARDLPPDVVCLLCKEGLALMELWRDKQIAILVDAANSGARPGSVFRFEVQVASPLKPSFRGTTHNYGLPEAIELGKALKVLPRHLIVYGIEGKSFGVEMGLSPEVEGAAEGVVQSIVKEVWEEK